MKIKNMHGIRRGLWATTPWLIAGLTLGFSHPPSSASRQAAYTYQGTVQAVRPRSGELDLLTGVGHALRVVRLRAVAATDMSSAGQKITLAQVQVGDIVRAECHQTDAGLVADRIEKLGRFGAEPGAPGGRSP